MFTYIMCYLPSLFFAYLATKTKRKDAVIFFSVISILIPAVFGGVRHKTIGVDVMGYGYGDALYALNIDSLPNFVANTKGMTEIAYQVLCYVSANMFNHPNGALFAYQLVTVSGMYIGAYRLRDIAPLPLSMLVFFTLHHQGSFNGMRQNMACAIILAGFYTLRQKRYSKFLLYVLAAFTFHASAIVAAVSVGGLYMISTSEVSRDMQKPRPRKIAYLVVLAVVAFQPIMSAVLEYMMNFSFFPAGKYMGELNDESSFLNKITFELAILSLGPVIMLILYRKGAQKLFRKGSLREGEADFFLVNSLMMLVEYAIISIAAVRRIFMYSDYIEIIVFASLPRLVSKKKFRMLVGLTVVAIMLLCWYGRYFAPAIGSKIRDDSDNYYRTVLLED